MKGKQLVVIFVGILILSIAIVPLAYGQDSGPPRLPTPTPTEATLTPTATPASTQEPIPGETPEQTRTPSGTPTPRITLKPTPQAGGASWGNNLLYGGAAVVVVIAVLGALLVFKKKRRVSETSLKKYSAQKFQDWVIKQLDGKAAASQDVSIGIDGFTSKGYPVLIRQSDSVGMMEVDRFAAALAKNRMRNGVIVAFGFGGDAIRGKVRAKTAYRIDIETLTVNDLINYGSSY